MPIASKCSTADDIVNGLATVAVGTGRPVHYDRSPTASGGFIETQHLSSGDSLLLFQTLDQRYKVGPSGWSI